MEINLPLDVITVLEGLRAAISFERTSWATPTLQKYVDIMNNVMGLKDKIIVCTTCSALTKRVHSDFQYFVWKWLLNNYPVYVPPLPAMKTKKFATEFWQTTLRVNSFEHLRNCKEQLRKDLYELKRKGMEDEAQNFADDDLSLTNYIKTKLDYFLPGGYMDKLMEQLAKDILDAQTNALLRAKSETLLEKQNALSINNITQTDVLLATKEELNWDNVSKMLDDGKKQVEIAKYFGVEKYVITRIVQKNKKEV